MGGETPATGGALRQRMDALAQESERRRRLAQLRKETLRKAEFLKRKSVIEPHDVYALTKDFFKQFLGKPYEFTIRELTEELKSVYISNDTRKQLTGVLDRLHSIEYSSVTYAHADLVRMLDDFAQAVQQLVRTHERSSSLLSRMRAFLFREESEPEIIMSELPVVETPDAQHVRIHTLVERCYAALDKRHFSRARAGYRALVHEYGLLADKEKERYYPLVEQTYRDLLNRAAAPVAPGPSPAQ